MPTQSAPDLPDLPGPPGPRDDCTPIADYALIGNCRTAALVSRHGSIDWLCLPDFAGPSVFGALLDSRRGGRFSIRPREAARVERCYASDTNVLQTTFNCAQGVVRLTDFFAMTQDEQPGAGEAGHEIVRLVEALSGRVELDAVLQPRPDYGRQAPHLASADGRNWSCGPDGGSLFLASDVDWSTGQPDRLEATFALGEGERRAFVLRDAGGVHDGGTALGDRDAAAAMDDVAELASARLRDTLDWWRRWCARCHYDGPYRDAVLRSCLALKLLMYHPSGAVVAAPTTSLPEGDSGKRNWDYRYCWLRDASLVLHAFNDLGYPAESDAFLKWLLRAAHATRPRLQVVYGVHGEASLPESTLPHWQGWCGIGPVHVGNAAHQQRQLDLYGEVVLTAYDFVQRGGALAPQERELLAGFGQVVLDSWRLPDKGIWEIRLPDRHNTHSKVMCWVALERLLRLHRQGVLQIDEARFAHECELIRADVDAHGFDAAAGSYVGYYGGRAPDAADASLLVLARVGYLAPDDPRMAGTCEMVERALTHGGLLYRYRPGKGYDGVGGQDHPFVICGFWLADQLARTGRTGRAREVFERVLARANDVGLMSEEVDVDGGRLMGNFPQAFSHVGLINAALSLQRAHRAAAGETAPG